MRVHCLQHESYESLGCIEDWINKKGYPLSSTKFYKGEKLPPLKKFDFLIIMGGPMGVYDEEKYPWLKDEKRFIKDSISNNKIILGICLGSQLLADALGSRIFKNNFKEIGWFPVQIKRDTKFFKDFPAVINVCHWHGDTYDLPEGAVHAGESEGCKNQAFYFNDNLLGLQFHLEFTRDSLKELLTNGREELIKDKYIQTEEEILMNLDLIPPANQLIFKLLDRIDQNCRKRNRITSL
jgi:GMP synthase (glutamine-hydrolysing)